MVSHPLPVGLPFFVTGEGLKVSIEMRREGALMNLMQKITPFLWFDDQAEEAITMPKETFHAHKHF